MLDSQDTQFHSPRNLYKCHNLSSIGSCIALSWFSHGCDSPGLNRNKINKPTVSISKGKVEVSAFSIGMPRVTLRTCSFMHKLQIMAVSFHCFWRSKKIHRWGILTFTLKGSSGIHQKIREVLKTILNILEYKSWW
jgi:hypothetical protein